MIGMIEEPLLYTNPTIIAAAIVTVVAAIAAAIVTVINAHAAANDRKEAKASRIEIQHDLAENTKKTDTIIEKTIEIHTVTNSNLSKVTASLEVALTKISGLEAMITELNNAKRVADNLAIRQQIGSTTGGTLAASAVNKIADKVGIEVNASHEPILKDIRKNTEDTVAAVEELGKKKLVK